MFWINSMQDVYTLFRLIYFVWGFALLMCMIYWGLQDLILGKKCGHVQVPPEHYLFATATMIGVMVLCFSIGEIEATDPGGGIRTFLPIVFLAPASIAVSQGSFRVRMHRRGIENGACEDGKHYHKESE